MAPPLVCLMQEGKCSGGAHALSAKTRLFSFSFFHILIRVGSWQGRRQTIDYENSAITFGNASTVGVLPGLAKMMVAIVHVCEAFGLIVSGRKIGALFSRAPHKDSVQVRSDAAATRRHRSLPTSGTR